MKFPMAVLVISMCAANALAEVIAGPTEVLDKPYGRVLYTLNDGVRVECAAMDNHFQRIAFVGVVKDAALWGRDRLKKREFIYGLNGEVLGESVRQVDLPIGKIPREPGEYAAAFTGYVAWTHIERDSEVERALEPIVDRKLHPLPQDDVIAQLARFGVKKGVSKAGFDTYSFNESPLVEGANAAPRLVLVFRAGRFVAVLAKRDINFMAHSPVFVRDGYTLTYVEPLDKTQSAKLERELVAAAVSRS